MKIAVYAICKNEEKHVNRFMDSTKGADLVSVCDTGSNDGTVTKLRERGAVVHEIKIEPWRFDEARNKSLELLPSDVDVCVCLDLDETLMPDWRAEIERVWSKDVDRLCCKYAHNHRPDGSPDVTFMIERFHRRNGYVWRHPVHEYVYWTLDRQECKKWLDPSKIVVEHWRDHTKSRGQYLELLEWAVREDAENDRNSHYLAREYLYAQRWVESKQEFMRHLSLKNAKWDIERCASMRYIAHCCIKLGQESEAQQWLLQACAQCLYEREPWVELAQFYLDRKEWLGAYHAAKRALTFTQRPLHYVTSADCWGAKPYVIAGIAAANLGFHKEALKHHVEVARLNPSDQNSFKRIHDVIDKFQ